MIFRLLFVNKFRAHLGGMTHLAPLCCMCHAEMSIIVLSYEVWKVFLVVEHVLKDYNIFLVACDDDNVKQNCSFDFIQVKPFKLIIIML